MMNIFTTTKTITKLTIILGLFMVTMFYFSPTVKAAEITLVPGTYSYGSTSEFSGFEEVQGTSINDDGDPGTDDPELADTGATTLQSVLVGSLLIGAPLYIGYKIRRRFIYRSSLLG